MAGSLRHLKILNPLTVTAPKAHRIIIVGVIPGPKSKIRIPHRQQHRRRHLTTLPNLQPSNSIDPFETPAQAQTIASLRSISSNPSYLLLGTVKNPDSLRKIHALLIVHGLPDDLLCKTKLVSLYGSFGRVEVARSVFDGIPCPDFYSHKVMIRWYFLNELYDETVMFYNNCLRKCLRESDDIVFSIVLKACCQLRDADEGRKIHCRVVKAGSLDSFVLTSLVDMYAKCGEIESSREAFNEISDNRDVVSWTSLIAGYVQNDCVEQGLDMFNKMREHGFVEVNQFTLGSLVAGCGKLRALHQGKWLHGCVIKMGIMMSLNLNNPLLATALLDMYVKCGSVRDARSVFDGLSTIDLVSWTAMIVGYAQMGEPDEALRLFVDRRRWTGTGILPNSVTIASVLSACGQLASFSMGRATHCLALKLNVAAEDEAVENALIDMYAKCRAIGDARYIFDDSISIPRKKDTNNTIAWNSIISGYWQNGDGFHALVLFRQMISSSSCSVVPPRPDAVTFVSAISACASLGGATTLAIGSSLHAYLVKAGISSAYVGTALLNFYAKCGDDAVSARLVFDEMQEKNAVTWGAMISAYGIHGDSDESIAVFSNMLSSMEQPNEAIFSTVLSACSRAGKLGDGCKHFSSMCQRYGFVPAMKHYACMVDLMARVGRLKEALDFIEGMPIRPDASVYGPFLHGCSLHSGFDLGDVVARRMLDLYPDEACYYVLLSNYYSLDGRWNQANQVRDLMKQRRLSKSPGWSSADLDQVSCLASVG
ncbi:hypothetical protein Dimus_031271 [Dionaea muscipula]